MIKYYGMPKNIVIIGAGFGGLRAAILLGKKIKQKRDQYKVILIDRHSYHTYTPLLYEAATTPKEIANYLKLKSLVTIPIIDILKKLPVKFINSEVTSIDLNNGKIHCRAFEVTHEELKFDYLILAPGSEINYFGIPGLEKHALPLKTFMDAVKIRDAIVAALETKKEPAIIIGGGGSTGVELAGELKIWQPKLRITIVEASPTILPGLEEAVIKKAARRLEKLGVEILTGEIITEAQKETISLKSGKKLSFDVLIWAGGVKASSLIANLPLKLETKGRIETAPELFCLPQTENLKLYGEVYGIGDVICCYDPNTKKPMPMVARAAIVQANIAVHNIFHQKKKAYYPTYYPYVIPIGGKYAIAKVGPLIISGLCGWILKELVEINYLFSIIPWLSALKIWLKSIWLFIQNEKLGRSH